MQRRELRNRPKGCTDARQESDMGQKWHRKSVRKERVIQ